MVSIVITLCLFRLLTMTFRIYSGNRSADSSSSDIDHRLQDIARGLRASTFSSTSDFGYVYYGVCDYLNALYLHWTRRSDACCAIFFSGRSAHWRNRIDECCYFLLDADFKEFQYKSLRQLTAPRKSLGKI